jgi:hypothetical protein
MPFFHILMFSLCSGYNLGMAWVGKFDVLSSDLNSDKHILDAFLLAFLLTDVC